MNVITKDIYEYLTNFVDDKTILNMLSVNKKFNDEEIFKRVLIRKYPLLVQFKKETYKELFVRMTYYIHMLKKYGIPYFHVGGYNPEENYKKVKVVDEDDKTYQVYPSEVSLIAKYQTLQIPIYLELQKHFPDFTIRINNQWIDMKKKIETCIITMSIEDAESVEKIQYYVIEIVYENGYKHNSFALNIQELKQIVENVQTL